MNRIRIGATLVAALVSSGAARPEAVTPTSFSVVLEQLSTGWAAQCETGCGWKAMSFICASACGAVVDSHGLVTLASRLRIRVGFRFTVEPTTERRGAIVARASSGTSWSQLAWTCPTESCRVRVSDAGVALLSDAR